MTTDKKVELVEETVNMINEVNLQFALPILCMDSFRYSHIEDINGMTQGVIFLLSNDKEDDYSLTFNTHTGLVTLFDDNDYPHMLSAYVNNDVCQAINSMF